MLIDWCDELVDSILFHLLRLRSALQSMSETLPSVRMVTHHHGSLGDRHDLDGYRAQLHGLTYLPVIPRSRRSWLVPRSGILYHDVVL